MSTTDQALPWALKIMMIALVTVAVFIYRKPFQHLFSSVGYGMLGAEERAQVSWRESAFGFRRVTANAAGAVMPNVGAARAARWARRGAADAPSAAEAAAGVGGVAAAGATVPESMQVVGAADSHGTARQWPEAGVGTGRTAPPLPLPSHGSPVPGASSGPPAGWARGAAGTGTARRPAPPARQPAPPPARQNGTAAPAPRPSNGTNWPAAASRTRSGDSSSGATGGGAKPPAAPFWSRSRRSK